jgi:hypothetical protein
MTVPVVGVREVVVAALGAGELPALLLENPNKLPGADRR